MRRLIVIAFLCGIAFIPVKSSRGEDYSECRQRCDSEYSDCVNEPPAPDPEVREAELASCDSTLASCRAQCENLKPPQTPSGMENNPNIIRK